ncbi:hypothetical protein [Aeromicrobium sp.]|uniref:hypothetical protein n=1 Tax=Aeromicrobium sp. TaxID=1871063 RepID=UPI003D6C3D82
MSTRMGVVAATWSVSVLVALFVTPSDGVRGGATVVHLLSLAVGFGAVVMIDWHGLLWLARRRGLAESTRLAAAAGPLIWAGWGGLLASGSFLDPDFTSVRTWVKLLVVLAIGLNGAAVSTIADVLRVLPPSVSPKDVPASLRFRIAASTVTSQVGWWSAIVIGFMAAL